MPGTIETDRLIIRPLDLSVADLLHDRLWSDPEVMRTLGDGKVRSRQQMRAALERGHRRFAGTGLGLRPIFEKATGELIGECGLLPLDGIGPEIELVYALRRASWGRGYATEAGAALEAHAMSPVDEGGLGFPRLVAITYPENVASGRVLEKLGFERAGTAGGPGGKTFTAYETGPLSLPLQTERLILRGPRPEDFDPLYEGIWGNEAAMRFLGEGVPVSREEALHRFEHRLEYFGETGLALWTLVERLTGKIIGDCGIVPIDRRGPEPEIGYRLFQAAWGKGYATEAARAAKHFAMAPPERGGLGVTRLLAVTHPENFASRRVLEKLGFSYVGSTDEYYGQTTALHESTGEAGKGAPPVG